MSKSILLLFAAFICHGVVSAQVITTSPKAIETVQPSQPISVPADPSSVDKSSASPEQTVPIDVVVPAGTLIDVEAAHTISSKDVRPGESLSFRVLVPIVVNGFTAIEKDALVTARVTVARRGGHWGKAGRLIWTMQDVVAANNSRIALSPDTRLTVDDVSKPGDKLRNGVKGTSHGKEVAARTIVAAAIFPPLAPLALMHGFRRGENAVLPEGKRFVAVVKNDSTISVTSNK